MKRRFMAAYVFVVLCTWTAEAQESAPPPAGSPSTALEALQRHIERTPQPLGSSDVSLGLGFFIGGTAVTLGCVGLALIPPTTNGGSPEGGDDYLQGILLLGALQGYCTSGFIGMGLSLLFFPSIDLRAEYGSLLDLDEKDREQRAALILGKKARREKQQQVAAFFITIAAAALPAGAYYLGTRIWGPNPSENFGQAYLGGIAAGSLLVALFIIGIESDTARDYEQFGRRE